MSQVNYLYSLSLRLRASLITLSTSCQLIWLSTINKKATAKDFDKILSRWSNNLIALLKAKVILNNPHNLKLEKGKRYIIMCNHTSFYDIPLSYAAFPKSSVRMLAKKELSKIPVFGKAMKAASFPFIDRQDRRQAIRDLNFAKKLMEEGIVLWIAPEGTRSTDGQLNTFKKGAFITAIQAKATLIPLAITGAFELYDKKTKKITLNQKVTLSIGTPIDATTYKKNEKDQLVSDAHQAMKALLSTS